MTPSMIVIAGPPGSGKSSIFPVSKFNVPFFNADDRAAALNGGSYHGLTTLIRQQVNKEFEAFIWNQINSKASFALETTLRSKVTFDQAAAARAAGFTVEMRYLALGNFGQHLQRVKARAFAGGHSASEATLRRIFDLSMANLKQAIQQMDLLEVYDNSAPGGPPVRVLESHNGEITFVADDAPPWLLAALD